MFLAQLLMNVVHQVVQQVTYITQLQETVEKIVPPIVVKVAHQQVTCNVIHVMLNLDSKLQMLLQQINHVKLVEAIA